IWAEVLGLERVGVEDNFFELGGHSLLATQVTSRIEKLFMVHVELRLLFETPTVREIACVIEQQRVQPTAVQRKPMLPVGRQGPLPLSYGQQRMWFIHQLEPDSLAYNVPIAVKLKGHLNVEALRQAMTAILLRHEVLRTQFVISKGVPLQRIVLLDELQYSLSYVDLDGLTPEQQEAEVQSQAIAEATYRFNLGQGLLFRSRLLCLNHAEHVLLLTMHHAVSDGWSMGILVREITAFYHAFAKECEALLPALNIQYADFSVWQREFLQGDVLENHLAYWRKQLRDVPVLDLPTDFPRPAILSRRAESFTVQLSLEQVKRLREVCQKEGVSLFMLLLASFQLLLSRWTGQQAVAVGTPIANRNYAEIEGLIGFFVNTLVLHTDLSGNPSVRGLLSRVREVCFHAYAHQDLPFELLVEELKPSRTLSRSPLFQAMLTLQNAPLGKLQVEGMEFEILKREGTTEKFDLDLALEESESGISGALTYATDLFAKETIARIMRHWLRILDFMAGDSGRLIADIDLLDHEETFHLTEMVNQTHCDYRRDSCLHELFEEAAEEYATTTAVSVEQQNLNYSELNALANQLAHHLRECGIHADMPVGVCTERSLDMVVAMLGIMKAGGAYLPLDPSYPVERLAHMLQDSRR